MDDSQSSIFASNLYLISKNKQMDMSQTLKKVFLMKDEASNKKIYLHNFVEEDYSSPTKEQQANKALFQSLIGNELPPLNYGTGNIKPPPTIPVPQKQISQTSPKKSIKSKDQ